MNEGLHRVARVQAWGSLAFVFLLLGLVLVAFLLAPLVNLLALTPGRALAAVARDDAVRDAIALSLATGFATATLAFLFGAPLAFLLARREFRGKGALETLVDLPIVVPHAVAGIALLALFGTGGPIGKPLWDGSGIRLSQSVYGVVLAQLFVASPFLVKSAQDAFAAVPRALEVNARLLGASPLRSFLQVSLPLARRGVLTGFVLTWARAVSEFGATVILASTPATAPVKVYQVWLSGSLEAALALALLLVAVAFLALLAVRWLDRAGTRAAVPARGGR